MDCGSLTDPANGSVNHTSGTTFGQTATYTCNTGYNLVGDSTRTCQATGVWSGSEPTCQGMYMLLSNISYQTKCIPPEEVENSTHTCQATGVWSGSTPICQGSLVPRPSHHPVFDCLYSMKKMERKGLEAFIRYVSLTTICYYCAQDVVLHVGGCGVSSAGYV